MCYISISVQFSLITRELPFAFMFKSDGARARHENCLNTKEDKNSRAEPSSTDYADLVTYTQIICTTTRLMNENQMGLFIDLFKASMS